MNYVLGNEREQLKIECLEQFIEKDNEVRIIDKIANTKIKKLA